MTIHLLGLPQTQTTKFWSTCAFTQKVLTLAAMLHRAGRDCIVYSGEENEAPCREHVTVVTEADRERWFGDETYTDRVFDRWAATDPCWVEMCANMVAAIRERAEPGDVLSLTMGLAYKPVADAVSMLAVELGIGYEASFSGFRVFESHAWMHHTYGRQGIDDGRYFDAVIPNAFDPADFEFRADKDDYLLFLGRHTARKGLAVVQELAKHHRIVTAGQEGPLDGCEYAGVVRGRDRAELLAGARALLAPTGYIEPFGGVAVEAQLSGTPVIGSPWGAFPETVAEGVTGFLPHTLGGLLDAADQVAELDPHVIRDRALSLYSLDAVAPLYDRYLDRLATLHGDGWYTTSALTVS